MEKHYEEALISLKRKYDKDDLVRALIVENNKLKLQIDELDEYKHKADKKAEKKFKDIIKKYNAKIKRLEDNNICLLLKVNNYEKGTF